MPRFTINTVWLKSLKVGDVVTRWLAGEIPQDLKITEIDDKIIYCNKEHGWWFDRATGCEIDDDLDWGPPPKMTGSIIQPKETTN